MKCVTITVPEDLARQLEREARRRGLSVGLVREALEEKFGQSAGAKRVIPWIGIGASGGKGPHAADLDEYLEETWADRYYRRVRLITRCSGRMQPPGRIPL